VPPAQDPYLAHLTPTQQGYVEAGHDYSSYMALTDQDRQIEADPLLERFRELSPPDTLQAVSPARELLRE
jgi:hypothetical protein